MSQGKGQKACSMRLSFASSTVWYSRHVQSCAIIVCSQHVKNWRCKTALEEDRQLRLIERLAEYIPFQKTGFCKIQGEMFHVNSFPALYRVRHYYCMFCYWEEGPNKIDIFEEYIVLFGCESCSKNWSELFLKKEICIFFCKNILI